MSDHAAQLIANAINGLAFCVLVGAVLRAMFNK